MHTPTTCEHNIVIRYCCPAKYLQAVFSLWTVAFYGLIFPDGFFQTPVVFW